MQPRCAILLAPTLLIAACAAPLPTYPPMPDREALDTIAARHASIRYLSARCTITLTSTDGDSVSLDGALAAAPPEHLRLRAWKLGHAVFDLTLTPAGVWLLSEDNPGQPDAPSKTAAGIRTLTTIFSPDLYTSAVPAPSSTDSELHAANDSILLTINRAHLTTHRLTFNSSPHRTISLERYRLIGSTPLPTRLHISAPEGSITIALSDLELNEPLPPAAFTPPRRATQLP